MSWNLKTYSGIVHEGYLWFANNSFNGLFKKNIQNGELKFVSLFPKESSALATFKKCIFTKNKLFFIPARAKYIHIYDLKDEEFTSIKVEKRKNDFCADAVLVGEDIYIFPADKSKDLLCLNTQTISLSIVPSFRKKIEELDGLNEKYVLCRVTEDKGNIYFAFNKTDMVARYDTKNDIFEVYHTRIADIFACYFMKENCWITTCNTSEIFLYDFEKKPRLIYSNNVIMENKRIFNNAFLWNEKICFLPAYSDRVIAIDLNMKICEYVCINREKRDKVMSFGMVQVGEELWLLPFGEDSLYVIDRESIEISSDKFEVMSDELKCNLMKELVNANESIIKENSIFSINDFIKTYL